MIRIPMRPEDLGREIRARIRKTPQIIDQGVRRGAMGGMYVLKARNPVDTGNMRNAWKAGRGPTRKPGDWEVYNDAPYAGIVEAGARPHPVSEEGLHAIARWARLKLGLGPEEAMEAARAIAWKLRHHGQKATYFVRDSMGEIRHMLLLEVVREIQAFAARPAGGK